MTTDEAKIIVLSNELQIAKNKIEFLHNCLTNPKHYRYAFPDSTEKFLQSAFRLLSEQSYCVHSITKQDCESCQDSLKQQQILQEAKTILRYE